MTQTPDTDQLEAIRAVEGNIVVIAGPGSGKTATLIERYRHMLLQGIQMQDILNLTFTNSAACEMVERAGLLDADRVFRTFHSFALDLIKRERAYIPFQLCETVIPVMGESLRLMKDLVHTYPQVKSYKSLAEKLSEWKRANIDPEIAIEQTMNDSVMYFYAEAYKDYERRCRREGWLDFDSLMKEAVKLLETNDVVRKRNQKRYIAVDECQDTDVVQFRLLQLLYGGNIFAVGDENQLIYEWRSAQPGNLTNFGKTFPGSRKLYLGRNYRSTGELVEFFKKILPVDNGIGSHMVSQRGDGIPPRLVHYQDELMEVVQTLRQIDDPANTAILARTNRQLLAFQKACMVRNIKSKILGHKNLWQENEVKHLLKLAKESPYQNDPAHQVLSDIIMEHNLTHLYYGVAEPNEKDPVENLNDVVKMAGRRPMSLADFLEWFRRLTFASRSQDKNPTLTLSTVHQAKGREWKHVFVVGAHQGMMPHKDGELLEEHRIFFVACSRAADTLTISFWKQPSQFLNNFREEIEEYEPES